MKGLSKGRYDETFASEDDVRVGKDGLLATYYIFQWNR